MWLSGLLHLVFLAGVNEGHGIWKSGIRILYAYFLGLQNSSPNIVSFNYLPMPAPSQESNGIIHILKHVDEQVGSIIKKNGNNWWFATVNFALCPNNLLKSSWYLIKLNHSNNDSLKLR